ncbi:hypothetical protein AIOL_001589 [Candidatus Rhodobacter oscarellae]|uniref:DUF177 domain-containing protein n=1 Tax=Candidatus Rhodobacter oscarellae TaxID=1675527 RepID=A0A0J9E1P7_9RHOB|nr:YceD family protein [Candidatus Rhodobacter lobularis]KMW56635.1 hypothetical protein AIOL_001589 [Candidatus Rhodobacter lobularis]
MGITPDSDHVWRMGDLAPGQARTFALLPEPEARAQIATALGFRGLRKLRFEGALRPSGKRDWQLAAQLGATVVQDCVITLEPVVTRIDTPVERLYVAELPELSSDAEEIEMPQDDTVEPIPAELDLLALLHEALAIAAPDYPRKDAAELEDTNFAAPGTEPLSDEAAKPFAGLAGLRDKLQDGTG